jgi:TonB family protein
MGPETVLPPASSSDTATGEFAVEPNEPIQSVEPNEPEDSGPEEAPPKSSSKTNFVAHEVRVKATGARPGDGPGQRELFTEETSTVLVFEMGGVIRLSAAVAPGQLLFLTNEESKREVVAQVSRKRTYKPTSCYVELEFTEPAPGFWGMEFSAATALLPKDAQEAELAALVNSAETTADVPGEPVTAPTAEEVEALKRDVEALQIRLQSPQPPAPAEPMLMLTTDPAPTPDSLPAPVVAEVPHVETPSSSAPEAAPSFPFAAESLPIARNPVPVQLTAAEQALLPTPSLDFSKSLPKRRRSLRARGNFTPSFRAGALRLALLSMALVVTIVGAAWYQHWIPWPSAAKNSSRSAPSNVANTKPSTVPGGQNTAGANTETGSAKLVSDPQVTSPDAPSQNAPVTSAADPAPKPSENVQPEIPEKPASRAAVSKRPTVRPVSKIVPDAATSSADDGVIVPPKLITSVRAVASLEDLRDFERGNVTIDAVVDTLGEVRSINVLSGPPSLREPAAAAFRQYKYEPATRNGKPVPAHVTVTIHFRFEP